MQYAFYIFCNYNNYYVSLIMNIIIIHIITVDVISINIIT